MRYSLILAAMPLFILQPVSASAQADLTEEILACSAVADSLERLRCYDDIVDQSGVAGTDQDVTPDTDTAEGDQVTILDIIVDSDQWSGSTVRVEAAIMCMGRDMCMGRPPNEMMSTQSIMVDVGSLDRAQRREVLSRCTDMSRQCRGEITGQVGSGIMGPSIVAESVNLN